MNAAQIARIVFVIALILFCLISKKVEKTSGEDAMAWSLFSLIFLFVMAVSLVVIAAKGALLLFS